MGSRILLVCLLAVAATGCANVQPLVHRPAAVVAKKQGPPPHAPAHGYRHKQRSQNGDVELVFNTKLGVYVVVGWPGHYYRDGHYYRQINRLWHKSVQLDTGWVKINTQKVPRGLAKKRGKKRNHPAKHGY